MALVFMDGFDKYGPANSNLTSVPALLTAGEWSTATGGPTLVTPLSSTGQAVNLSSLGAIAKTLGTNYPRLIGGLRFSGTLTAQAILMQFRDGATAQCSINVETTGVINIRTGAGTGTILNSGGSISANSTHYLEWDVTIGASSAYQVWLDGVSLFSGTGNTRGGTANNYANAIAFGTSTTGNVTYDDLYLFDNTGAANNAVLLTSPRIETSFPASDSAVQFAVGAGILGFNIQRSPSTTNIGFAQILMLRRFVPSIACTLNSISILPGATSGTAQFRGVVYADSGGGVAGALMSAGAVQTGVTANTPLNLPLGAPQALSAGTPYWLGFTTDSGSVNNIFFVADTLLAFSRATITFSSGAPATAPAMTVNTTSVMCWGNLTGISGNNWYEVAQQPPAGVNSYIFDATVGHEDLFNFAPLSAPPANIYAVAVKANVAKSDSGAKTFSVRMKSVAADSPGSVASIAPGTSYGWATSLFPVDPNTSAAWTNAALAAATAGVKIES